MQEYHWEAAQRILVVASVRNGIWWVVAVVVVLQRRKRRHLEAGSGHGHGDQENAETVDAWVFKPRGSK